MKKLIRAALFILVLAVCTPADGIMQNDRTSPTPTPRPATTNTAQTVTGPEAEEMTQPDLVAAAREIALRLLETILTLY
jgi:hypothetical protein